MGKLISLKEEKSDFITEQAYFIYQKINTHNWMTTDIKNKS
jgi:hypothetical protein